MKARDILKKGRADPCWWIERVLGIHLWSKQREIVESVFRGEHRITSVRSCNGAGKSYVSAATAIAFLCLHPRSKVVTTASNEKQVRAIIWSNLRSFVKNAKIPLGGRLMTQNWHMSDDWFATGIVAAPHDPEGFQGIHAPHMLIIADEASGIAEPIWQTGIDSLMSNHGAKLLAIGNPTSPVGRFAKHHRSPYVNKIAITSFDTPNFTHFEITANDIATGAWREKYDPSAEPVPGLASPSSVAERIDQEGPEHPSVQAGVFANFPVAGERTLIPLTHLHAAADRTIPVSPDARRQLGLDVARAGLDETVAYLNEGGRIRLRYASGMKDTMESTSRAVVEAQECDASLAIDSIGVGGGVLDRAKQLYPGRVIDANGAKRAKNPDRFMNARAEWFWRLRRMFEKGEIDIDGSDSELISQLSQIEWKATSSGKVQIESKDEFRRRVGKSPDRGDACCYSIADPADDDVIIA